MLLNKPITVILKSVKEWDLFQYVTSANNIELGFCVPNAIKEQLERGKHVIVGNFSTNLNKLGGVYLTFQHTGYSFSLIENETRYTIGEFIDDVYKERDFEITVEQTIQVKYTIRDTNQKTAEQEAVKQFKQEFKHVSYRINPIVTTHRK